MFLLLNLFIYFNFFSVTMIYSFLVVYNYYNHINQHSKSKFMYSDQFIVPESLFKNNEKPITTNEICQKNDLPAVHVIIKPNTNDLTCVV